MTTITDLTAQLQSTHFDHIAFFFSKYHDFTYDPNANAASEFQRLAQHRGWGAKKKRTHHARFLKAFGAEFDAVFGAGDEWDWKYLCMLLGVVANSVTHARNVVSIYDSLEGEGAGLMGRGEGAAADSCQHF